MILVIFTRLLGLTELRDESFCVLSCFSIVITDAGIPLKVSYTQKKTSCYSFSGENLFQTKDFQINYWNKLFLSRESLAQSPVPPYIESLASDEMLSGFQVVLIFAQTQCLNCTKSCLLHPFDFILTWLNSISDRIKPNLSSLVPWARIPCRRTAVIHSPAFDLHQMWTLWPHRPRFNLFCILA